jgi:hypothetical protein
MLKYTRNLKKVNSACCWLGHGYFKKGNVAASRPSLAAWQPPPNREIAAAQKAGFAMTLFRASVKALPV